MAEAEVLCSQARVFEDLFARLYMHYRVTDHHGAAKRAYEDARRASEEFADEAFTRLDLRTKCGA